MYGQPKETCIDAARMHIFEAKYKPIVRSAPLDHIKGVDAEMLPPSKNTLHHSIVIMLLTCASMLKDSYQSLIQMNMDGSYSMGNIQ